MIREVELNLFVPSSELLVRLASGERPLGVTAGPPRIRVLRETYFDTSDHILRQRGMTCRLRQREGEDPSLVVTVGEGPDSEGITSRSRLTASAVGAGVFETLKGDSEPAELIRKFVEPGDLRPQVALDIQRLSRILRTRFLRSPVLLLLFDRITVQVGRSSSVFHELRVRRRRPGGPLIRDIAKGLRDEHHLFPDGLSTLQRARRILALGQKPGEPTLSPFALSLALALFRDGDLGLLERGGVLSIPTFRGSGEDAARALLADLTGEEELELVRLGTTDPREGRPALEVWASPSTPRAGGRGPSDKLVWTPWHTLLESLGDGGTPDPDLLPALLLLTRRRLLGQLKWIPAHRPEGGPTPPSAVARIPVAGGEAVCPEIEALKALLLHLETVEDSGAEIGRRFAAAGAVSDGLAEFFVGEIRGIKEGILLDIPPPGSTPPEELLDLLSVRIRGITDRLYAAWNGDFLSALEDRGIHFRSWSGLMHEDRRALLEDFSRRLLPAMSVVADWGPALIPDMPPVGCALGLTARESGSEGTRFFHVVLDPKSPSFMAVPGGTIIVPLEEVVQGFLFSRYPALERAETHLFRFRTAEVTVREVVPNPAFGQEESKVGTGAGGEEPAFPWGMDATFTPGASYAPEPDLLPLPVPRTLVVESLQSVVVRVVIRPRMPESHQAQLLRGLERQVSLRRPLIGWSDLYPVAGPMSLSGLASLLDKE